jgi:glycosyltransferase involved in cell wall biosynthesis
MVIHFFTKGDASVPSSRARIYYLADELGRRGYQTTIRSLGASPEGGAMQPRSFRSFWVYLMELRAIPKADPLVLQRTIYDRWFLLAALVARYAFGRRFFFDIDDATYLHSKWKMIALARAADAVISAGEYVATWARTQNRHVVIIPTGVDLAHIQAVTQNCHRANPEPVIGWVGNGPAHWDNLVFIAPVFKKLMDEGVSFRFTLVGTFGDARIPKLFEFLGDRLRVVDRLPPADVFPEICQFDIGIMPLKPDPWANAKYLKTIEYMACGVAAVASRLGENAHLIDHGKTGMLALTEDEWVEALRFVLTHREDRERMGTAAVAVAANFDIKRNTDRFLQLLTASKG